MRCPTCDETMDAWGEAGQVYACRRCGTVRDSEGVQVPKIVSRVIEKELEYGRCGGGGKIVNSENGMPATRVHDIVMRLRNYDECHDGDVDEAADMLEFFFGQMQMHSPKMNGQQSYRFRGSGWPMTHCVGPNAEDAVRSAIQEIKRSRSESA